MTTGMHNFDAGKFPVTKKTYRDQLIDVRGKVAHLVVTINRERGNEEQIEELRRATLQLQEDVKLLMVSRSTDRIPLKQIDDKTDELWFCLKEIRKARREERIIRDAERAMALDIKNAEEAIERKYSLKFYIYFFYKTVVVGWLDPEKLPARDAGKKPLTIVRANSHEEADAIKEAKENGTGGVKEMFTQQGIPYYVAYMTGELTTVDDDAHCVDSDGDHVNDGGAIEGYRVGTPNPGTGESDNVG